MTMNFPDIMLVSPGSPRIQMGAIVNLPLANLSLAAWLRQNQKYRGRIRILDMNVRAVSGEDFQNAGIVGVSAMTGRQIAYGLQAARLAREVNPDVKIIWGGIHASLLPEQTIAHELVDAIVIGEGEETFREVLEALSDGRELAGIPGTCVKTKAGEIVKGAPRPFLNMEALPLPAYDLINVDDYHGIRQQFNYQSSRGCPFRCGFCYNIAFCGRKWRSKSAKKTAEELDCLSRQYRVANFSFDDDEFLIDIPRAMEIFRAVRDKGLRFTSTITCRLDVIRKVPDHDLVLLREAGVRQVYLGAESGCAATLRNIHKDIVPQDIISGAAKTAHSGIRPLVSFMGGFPGETFKDFQETLDLIQALWDQDPLITVSAIFPYNPYPGTPLYEKSIALGFQAPRSLEEWAKWDFQYEPRHPWLDRRTRVWMKYARFLVRFRFYLARYEDRYQNNWRVKLIKILVWPLSFSAKVRWRTKCFTAAWEWDLFAFVVQKAFGYI